MNEMKYTKLTEVLGRWKAEVVESFLESEGIEVELIQDSLSHSFFIHAFAPVQIFVPNEKVEQARELMKDLDNVLQDTDQNDEEEEK